MLEVAIDKVILTVFFLSTDSDVRYYNTGDPVTQTYKFDCKGGEGDTILIEDIEVGNVGHRISEVKVYGNAVSPGILKLMCTSRVENMQDRNKYK